MNINQVMLSNGVEMPQEGFGVYQIEGFENTRRAVLNALSIGYRAIDTAQGYHNEEAVGQAIKDSNINRDNIFITTKIWANNMSYKKAKESFFGSLRKLKTDYLDLVIFHNPNGDYYGAYRALEELYRKGYIRAIGGSNLPTERYVDLANFADIVPMINQVETHVFNQHRELRKYAKKYGTYIEAWSPFAEGKNGLFTNDTLKEIGNNHNKSAAQVALRFLIQNNIIIIPKSTHINRMKENIDIWDFKLNDDEIKSIERLDLNHSQVLDTTSPKFAEFIYNNKKTL